VKGTGPDGRIVERDVKAALASPAAPAPAPALAPVSSARPPSGEDFTDTPVSMMRKTIAKRLVESKQTAPHFYLTVEVDAGPLSTFRAALNEVAGEEAKVSVNDLVVKAVALALRRFPRANASFLGDKIRQHHRVHVGVAVSVDDGLLTPVIRDTDTKGLLAIRAEIRDLAARAKIKKLLPDEMSGGTFTVSNLGMYGIDEFAAVINPGEGAILAVGRARKVPIVIGDELAIGERMSLTLSCDHRVIDGALGAQFLQVLSKILEHPAALAL
jgi:pyruvate dehydrogenase E2 component (dihydrolipoamide acetyltransferase)